MLILKYIRNADLDRLNEAFILEQLQSPKIFNYFPPFWNGTEYVITWYESMNKEYFVGEAIGGLNDDSVDNL